MPALEETLQQVEERLTVLHAQQGDAAAFRKLVELYDRRLLYFVRRILGEREEAFDVLQSVWLLVHRKLGTLSSPNAFRVWLYRIAHDQAVSELRRRTRQPLHLDEVAQDELPEDDVASVATFASAELVHAGLQNLSVDHRRVLTLRFLEDMSIADIAAVLRCSSGTIKSRLHYAKKALRHRIEELTHD